MRLLKQLGAVAAVALVGSLTGAGATIRRGMLIGLMVRPGRGSASTPTWASVSC